MWFSSLEPTSTGEEDGFINHGYGSVTRSLKRRAIHMHHELAIHMYPIYENSIKKVTKLAALNY